MNSFIAYLKNCWEEVTKHVTWPAYSSLQGSATLVLVASLLFALVVGFIDFAFENGLKFFYESL